MMAIFKKQRSPSSILGLAFDTGRLDGVVLRRSNGSFKVLKTFSAALALSPLTGDPELVGREIRNHLDQAGVRERRCAVCLPAGWALALQTAVPELPDADVASFLEIEAERGFPYGPEALSIGHSRYRHGAGGQGATLAAMPRNHLAQLEKALRSAQLRPVSFTTGITALQPPDRDASQGTLALLVGDSAVDLQVICGGGVAALRSLEGTIETEGVQKRFYADLLAREIRITLGQLPAEFRDEVSTVRVFGRGDWAQRFTQEVRPRLEAMGLRVEQPHAYSPDEFRSRLPAEAAVSPAVSLAARTLTGEAPCFEFLPPRTNSWQQFTARFSSRKLAWIGASAGALFLLVTGAFLVQEWQLSRLQSRWRAMQPKVRELDAMQQRIKQFRPWFDDSFRGLSILRRVTEAFPEDGAVSAKTLEIRDLSAVSCSGVARDNPAFLKMLDQLRAARNEVNNLKVDQVRGKTPLQFTLNFQWGGGEGGGQ